MEGAEVHPTAVVEERAKIGAGTKVWHFSHIRKGAEIGKNCTIGKCVYVDVGVKVGNNVKVQNHVSIYRGVEIEDDVLIGPHVTFTNDPYPRAFSRDWEVVPTRVCKGASIGANSTILCGVRIGEYAMIGAGSVVTKDVPPFGLVYGNPAQLKGYVCYCGRKLGGEGNVRKCSHCGKVVRL